MWNMADAYKDNNKKSLTDIEYIKGLYELQKYEARKAKHIEELLLEDYIRTVKTYITRYDLLDNIFLDARGQIETKLKKDRPQLETLKEFIMEDFLNNDKNFKITQIMQCGYEGYAWCVEFEGYGKTFRIQFPVKKNITAKNLNYASYGKFDFSVEKNEAYWNVIKSSYVIEDISEAIRDYFDLEKSEVEVDD